MSRSRSRSPRIATCNLEEVTWEQWRTDAPCSTCPKETGTYRGWNEFGETQFYCCECWASSLIAVIDRQLMEKEKNAGQVLQRKTKKALWNERLAKKRALQEKKKGPYSWQCRAYRIMLPHFSQERPA